MSKERARRRAERLAAMEKEKAARARKAARRQRRRQLVRALTPRLGRPGRIYRSSTRERLGFALVPLLAIAAVWLLVPDVPLRVVLSIVIVIAMPVLVVLVRGRRA